jgi:hypothetical protein
MNYMKSNFRTLIVSFLSLAFISCGGGSSDGAFGASFVAIDADPSSIDVGDSTFVVVDLDELDSDGIFLKIRFPRGAEYLLNSSYIRVGGEDIPREPDLNFASETENYNYLVYYLSKELFDGSDEGSVSFELIGRSRVSNGEIEVDPDIDNPNIPNDTEFDMENPEFQAEDSTGIRVS